MTASHPGIRIGAAFPLKDSAPAQICGICRRKSIELSFASGRRAEIEFRDSGKACEAAHEHSQECDTKSCEISSPRLRR